LLVSQEAAAVEQASIVTIQVGTGTIVEHPVVKLIVSVETTDLIP